MPRIRAASRSASSLVSTAGPVLLRPYLGLGTVLVVFDHGADSGSGISVVALPGILAHYLLGDTVDVGVDAHWQAASSDFTDTVSLLGSAGLTF